GLRRRWAIASGLVHKGRVSGNCPSVCPGWVRGCLGGLWDRDEVPEPEAGGRGGVVALQGTPTPLQRLATSATSATTHRQPPQPRAPRAAMRCRPAAPPGGGDAGGVRPTGPALPAGAPAERGARPQGGPLWRYPEKVSAVRAASHG